MDLVSPRVEGHAVFTSPPHVRFTWSRVRTGNLSLMDSLGLVRLKPLMAHTHGRPDIMIGLIDGPVAMNHPDLAGDHIREIPAKLRGTCARSSSAACRHGTFVAGILGASRSS